MSERPISDEERQAGKMIGECGAENLALSSLMGYFGYQAHKQVIGRLKQDNPIFQRLKRNKSILAGLAGLFTFGQSFGFYAKYVCRPRLEKSFPGITEQLIASRAEFSADHKSQLTDNMKAKKQELVEQKRGGYGPLLDPKQDWSDDTISKPQPDTITRPVERYTYLSEEELPFNEPPPVGARQHDRYTYVSEQDKAEITGQSLEGAVNGKPVRRNKYGDIIYDSDY